MNVIEIAQPIATVADEATNDVLETVYAKMTETSKNAFRVETKHGEDLDSWPTLVGEFNRGEAIATIEANGYQLVKSWQQALRMEGWTKPWPRTTLV